MLKRTISLLLVFALCITVIPTTVLAQETDQRYTQDQMDTIVQKYENNEDMLNALFCTDAAIGYWGMANEIKQNGVLSWALDMSSKLIGEYPEKQDYAEMLANLITMQSGELAEQIESQSRFDDLKDIGDYAWDVVEIAAAFVGASGALETVSAAIDTGVDGISEVIIQNNDQAKYYEIVLQDYSQSYAFLSAISKYAENEELRQVALSLLEANDTLLIKRLEYLADMGENIAEYEAKFFIENMSMELLKEADLYATDETVKFFVDEGVNLKNAILSARDAADFMFKLIILAGDIGFGTSDVYNRYQEMKVVADIAGALVKANKAISLPAKTNQAKLEVIHEKCSLYKALIVTHARGEYLLYQLLMNDAGALSDIRWIIEYFKNPEDTTDAWYEGRIDVLTEYCDILDNMFVVSSMLDLDNLVTDAYVCDCTSSIESRYSYATGKSMTGMYRIPQINLSRGDVERINQEIYNSLYPMIEESVAEIKEYGYPGRSGEIEYNWAVNGDILSLVIRNFRTPSMTGWDDYTVYNLSIDSGFLISDAEVISAAGFTSGEFKQRAKEVLGSSFWGIWDLTNENFEQASFVEFFNDRLRRTLSDENIEDVRPYINEKGQLCIIGRKYSMAAGDSYLYDLNMIDFKFVDYYADEATVLSKAGNYEDTSDSVDYPASAFNVDASYRVGDVFQLGSYEQDGNTKNGTEPIQWRVLDSEQGKILVISEKAIECKQFHSKDKTVTWENSDLRQWLNNDFYQTAFSESERGYILLSNVSSEPNPKNNIDPGSNTSDYIYIPSISEMQQYFKSNSDRKCVATKYAISRGAYAPKDQNYCTWWLLRNPGEAGDKVANVNTDGRIDYVGSRVESINGAVRVMMWMTAVPEDYDVPVADTTENSTQPSIDTENKNDEIDYANGECGQNLYWALSVDGTLTISGQGDMYQFTYDDNVPWDKYRDLIYNVIVKDGVTSIGRFAFLRCKNLQDVTLPASINKIEYSAFQKCTSLGSIVLPNAIEELPKQAFSGCTNLSSITLPRNLLQINDYAFSDCSSLEEIELPDKLWFVGNYAFQGCTGLERIVFTDEVSIIGYAAFSFCSSLSSVTIPKNIDHLSDVFLNCTSLREVYFQGDSPKMSDRTFANVTATCYYPSDNKTWTISQMDNYGGNLTWIAQ